MKTFALEQPGWTTWYTFTPHGETVEVLTLIDEIVTKRETVRIGKARFVWKSFRKMGYRPSTRKPKTDAGAAAQTLGGFGPQMPEVRSGSSSAGSAGNPGRTEMDERGQV